SPGVSRRSVRPTAHARRMARAATERSARVVRGNDPAARQWQGSRGKPRLTSLVVKLQALRGAITCDEDSKAEIESKTTRMVKELFARNDLTPDDVVSMLFTTTS